MASYYQQAVSLEKKALYNKAIILLKKFLQDNKHAVEAWFHLGFCFSKLNKSKNAIYSYQKIIYLSQKKIIPNTFNLSSTYYNLATELIKNNNLTLAQKLLSHCIKNYPHFEQAFLLKGYLLFKLGKSPQALKIFNSILQKNQNNKIALNSIIMILLNQGEFTEANKKLDQFILYYPNDTLIKEIKLSINKGKDSLNKEIKEMTVNTASNKKLAPYLSNELSLNQKNQLKEKKLKIKNKQNKTQVDLLNLSLFNLFEGNTQEAMEYLLKSHTQKNN